MEENCVIVGLKEHEVELDLGLSIGGSFTRPRVEKLKPIKKDPDSGHRQKSQPLAADLQRKREIQAMRRQEAKKKREEKQQRRGLSSRAQNAESLSREQSPECKKKKVEFSGSSDRETKKANLNNSSGVAQNSSHNIGSVIPVHLSCWGGGGIGNVDEQAVKQGFRPFRGLQNPGSVFESDPNSNCRVERNMKSGSNSSLLSDLHSSSNQQEGGSSIDMGTNSNNGWQAEYPEMKRTSSASNIRKGQLEGTATSHQTDSAPSTNDSSTRKANDDDDDNHHQMINTESLVTTVAKVITSSKCHDSEISNVEYSRSSKTPASSSLSYMPCVSTTGEGPNGRTVNGFLHRYSQAEVSIVCVCHGTSFSPAQFVHHAGGTAVSHPLRHITVMPCTL